MRKRAIEKGRTELFKNKWQTWRFLCESALVVSLWVSMIFYFSWLRPLGWLSPFGLQRSILSNLQVKWTRIIAILLPRPWSPVWYVVNSSKLNFTVPKQPNLVPASMSSRQDALLATVLENQNNGETFSNPAVVACDHGYDMIHFKPSLSLWKMQR